jgi:hypothetical protein
MHSRDEEQEVVEFSTIPPEEYSHTVRLCSVAPEALSGATRKQSGLADGQTLLSVDNGLQHGESDDPHSLWAGLQTETLPPFGERGRSLQSP